MEEQLLAVEEANFPNRPARKNVFRFYENHVQYDTVHRRSGRVLLSVSNSGYGYVDGPKTTETLTPAVIERVKSKNSKLTDYYNSYYYSRGLILKEALYETLCAVFCGLNPVIIAKEAWADMRNFGGKRLERVIDAIIQYPGLEE